MNASRPPVPEAGLAACGALAGAWAVSRPPAAVPTTSRTSTKRANRAPVVERNTGASGGRAGWRRVRRSPAGGCSLDPRILLQQARLFHGLFHRSHVARHPVREDARAVLA